MFTETDITKMRAPSSLSLCCILVK